MHGKIHKGQTIYTCVHCEFSASTSQQLDDHMNKHRGTRPFQCSECGLMFAARADLRAHVTRTHRNSSTAIVTNPPAAVHRRSHRRLASSQRRYIDVSLADEDSEQQYEDGYYCSICQRQFTSARLLDRHTYAVHRQKYKSYNDEDYQMDGIGEDDIHDYADDELDDKQENKAVCKNENVIANIDEEDDLAPNVEDIIESDDDTEQVETIKSVSSANQKQIKFKKNWSDFSNRRQFSTKRSTKIK